MPKAKKGTKRRSARKGATRNARKGTARGRCWSGYKPAPGKAPFTKGSCMKST
jgi:hypothetical protein